MQTRTATTAQQRLARVVARLPVAAQEALDVVARREDLPLVAGTWQEGHGGCLVANVLASHVAETDGGTLDVRVLALFPELSSRDLNALIVAWDEAAEQVGGGDEALRRLLRRALTSARAGSAPVALSVS